MRWLWKPSRGGSGREEWQEAAACEGDRHVVVAGNLVLYAPADNLDYEGSLIGAYDTEAQLWLGWGGQEADRRTREWYFAVTRENRALMRLELENGEGRDQFEALDYRHFVAVEREQGRYAGGVRLHRTGDVDGWLAPHFRGRGWGADLFEGAAALAHAHLGWQEVRARVPTGHRACAGAVERAGFERQPPAPGENTCWRPRSFTFVHVGLPRNCRLPGFAR